MSHRLRVLAIGNNWDIGGTGQSIALRAAGLPAQFFSVHAVAIGGGGPLLDRLAAQGVSTSVCPGLHALSRVIQQQRPHILHYVRTSRSSPFSCGVLGLAREHQVQVVVETNIFGRPARDAQVRLPDLTVHVSLTSMLRYAQRTHTQMDSLWSRGQRVAYDPAPTSVINDFQLTLGSRRDIRRKLGVAENEVLACRVAAPRLRKWSQRLEISLSAMFKQLPHLRFVFMAVPPPKDRWLQERFGSRVIVLPPTADLSFLSSLYQCSDMMVHSSGIGESLGVSLIEAMLWKLPIVVDSTPDMDNAQIEVVDHLRTGLVVASRVGFVDAVRRLTESATMRIALGEAARQKALARFSDRATCAQWVRLYSEAAQRAALEVPPALVSLAAAQPEIPGRGEYGGFEAEYGRRLAHVMGPQPSLIEQGRVSLLHACDTLRYAKQVGMRTVGQVALSRLRSGSFQRN